MKNYIELTDEKLVKLFVDGNDKAFDTLYKRYQTRIYKYIYSSVKNHEKAEDLTQDTFVKILMSIRNGKYCETGKFEQWIMRITRNFIIDTNNLCANRTKYVSLDDTENNVINTNKHAITLENRETEYCIQQTLCDAKHLVTLLPHDQQQVFRMRIYEDNSFKDIANTTGVSINTALGRMRYAIINLRKYATQKGISA